jgi:hypothetical protein
MASAHASLPRLALSIRQPWCWAVVHAGKRLENRSWKRDNPGLKFLGPIALHAGIGMTQHEYHSAATFMEKLGIECPPPAALLRGGIIGRARVAGYVRAVADPWYMGPLAIDLDDVEPVEFIGCSGELGYFEWRPNGQEPQAPMKWMLPKPVSAPAPQLPLI